VVNMIVVNSLESLNINSISSRYKYEPGNVVELVFYSRGKIRASKKRVVQDCIDLGQVTEMYVVIFNDDNK